MKRTVYWQNPPVDRSLIEEMDSRLPDGSVSHEPLPDRWITTFEGSDGTEIEELMEAYRDAYSDIVGVALVENDAGDNDA